MKSTCFLAMIFSVMFCHLSLAQVSPEQRSRRRELMEDLLKGLIESQVSPNQPAPAQGSPIPGVFPFPKTIDGRAPGGHSPDRPGVVVDVSRDMLVARQYLQQWLLAGGNLVNELRFHEYENPGLRPFLADALRLHASLEQLNNKAQLSPNLNLLVEDFSLIDRDWRMLSYRLKQSGLGTSECQSLVNSIAELDSQLCGLFRVEPQLNRQELLRLSTELNANYRHLLQDIYYQTRDANRNQTKLLQQGQELAVLINQSTALIPRGSYDSIALAYRECNALWREFSRSLRSFPDQRVRRDIQEIENLGRQIQEQLWLTVELDREYVAHLVGTVDTDFKRLLESISINQLLTCEQPGIVLSTIREFQQSCQSFEQVTRSGRPPSELPWDFKLFENQWKRIHALLHNLQDPQIDHQLDEIDFTLVTLRQTFGAGPQLDYQSLVQILANLDLLCHQLNDGIHSRIDRRRYDRAFQSQIHLAADSLHETMHDLHRDILSSQQKTIDPQRLGQAFELWAAIRPLIVKCQPDDQEVFLQIRRQIEPLMVKLQVVFSD